MPNTPIELLTTFERPVRSPLPLIADSIHNILDTLPQFENDPFAYCEAIARCFNQAALLELHFGNPTKAFSLCMMELEWIQRLAHQSRLRGLLLYGLQPWVNLARLDRIQGCTDQAQIRLKALLDALKMRSIDLGELTILSSDWFILTERMPNLSQFLQMVWVCEMLLCGLRNQCYSNFDLVEKFIQDATAPDAQIALLEASLIAARLPSAPTTLHSNDIQLPETLSELQLHSLVLRRFELEALGSDNAGAFSKKIAALAQYHLSADCCTWQLALVQHSTALLLRLDRNSTLSISELAYAASDKLGDEIFSYWFAEACLEASNGASIWAERRASLSERSWYASIRTGDSSTLIKRANCIEELSQRLVSIATDAVVQNLANR